MKQIRVLIADDHAVVRKGIQMITNTEPSILVIGEARDGADAVQQTRHLDPDVVLMDLVMPHKNGIDAIAEIKQSCPNTKIIVLTTFEDDERIEAAIGSGADGYLLKDADGEFLLQAIQSVYKGDMPLHPRIARHLFKNDSAQNNTKNEAANKLDPLTEREREVLQLVAKGLSNKEIAQKLHLTTGTVKVHVSHILGKLNVSRRTEAAVLAVQMGLIPPEENS